MTELNDLTDWIGRRETSPPEALTPRLLDRFSAALSPHLAQGDGVPAGAHWCLSPPAVPAAELGVDGHPAKRGFLPPVPLPRRMWAGGELELLAPLRPDDLVTRETRIEDVMFKHGRSGDLCFVTLRHEYVTDRRVAIRERQDIVYRPAATTRAPAPVPAARSGADAEWVVDIDAVMLFRYSALTFNGHRIHYDRTYAVEEEGYPDLVIQGPLQATLLLNLAIAEGGSCPRRFSFRGVAAACGAQPLRCRAWRAEEGRELAAVSSAGVTTMTAQATW